MFLPTYQDVMHGIIAQIGINVAENTMSFSETC
jgi:hypothetical protein